MKLKFISFSFKTFRFVQAIPEETQTSVGRLMHKMSIDYSMESFHMLNGIRDIVAWEHDEMK